MNFLTSVLFKVITGFFSFVTAITSIFSPMSGKLPEAPDDFTPVLRFAVCSDVHLSGEEDQPSALKFATFFDDTYAYAEGTNYKKVDAFVVAGDMTNGGRDHEYQRFLKIKNDHIKDGTEFITVLGNHEFIEYRDTDSTVAYTKYKEYMGKDVDTNNNINGYHIIGVSYADDAKTFNGKQGWLKEQLDAAKKEDASKPVFVIQHPHPFATVYGSVNWSDLTTKTVLMNYPNVIDFSGHSHYAANDPRVIWQGAFTAVGTGSLSASIVNVGYIEGDCDAPGESGTYWIVEADANGNVRLKLYDAVSHKFFEKNDYYLPGVASRSSHYYNWNNLKALDTTPVFPEGAKVNARADKEGNMILSFPNAESYWGTETYYVELKGAESASDIIISNYVRADDDTMNINTSDMLSDGRKFPAGEYSYSIKPMSPYGKTGRALEGTFTYNGELN